MLKGFSSPLSPTGRSSLAPTPPWHYAGDLMVIEYWADPATVAHYLPAGGARNVQVSAGWTGEADLRFLPCDIHELGDLKPLRAGAGHRFSMGLTINTLTVLADLRG